FRFKGEYEDLLNVFINDKVLIGDIVNNGNNWDLFMNQSTDYGFGNNYSYTKKLGIAYEGSVIVVLYADFLDTLPTGTYSLTVEFKDGTFEGMPFIVDGNDPEIEVKEEPRPMERGNQPQPKPKEIEEIKQTPQDTNPKTGVTLFPGLLIVSGVIVLAANKRLNKRLKS
ncbi:MAG: hypothetical protein FWG33_02745, partial [Oscillospiraceae bacterium]|nr:hypothetical protein [Oscillospiraceae bacterium]